MAHSQIVGLLMVGAAGILSGIVAWPIKHMRRFRYEHWAFVGNFVALVLLPWSVLLAACPQAIAAFSHLPWTLILKANLFTLAWGVANVLVGLCLVRIGISLTIGLMMGVGLPIGVLVPMILRGSGIFAHAPELRSPAGAVMLAGVVVILAAIYFTTAAGFGRDNLIKRQDNAPGKFGGGFVMTVLAGFLQVGLSFAFVYTQSDIVKSLQGVGAAPVVTIIGVWAIALPGGAMVNILYPAWLLSKRHSWGVFAESPTEFGFCLLMAAMFFAFVVLNGIGMRTLGPLGASVGFGVYQTLMMTASQAVGFGHGEWRGINGLPRRQIYAAVAISLAAVCLMAYGNSLVS